MLKARTPPPFRRSLALVAAMLVALVGAGSAHASNTASFTDPSRDSGDAPDITGLTVSNDDDGTLTFRITVSNPDSVGGLLGGDVGVAIDVDQNPDTGSVYYGTEVGIMFDSGELEFLRPNLAGTEFETVTPPASLEGIFSGKTGTFTVKESDLGIAPNGGFNLVGISDDFVGVYGDTAPDEGTFNYELVPGTAAIAPGADDRAPVDRAFSAAGEHGKVVDLDYSAQDGRGETADTIQVYRRSRLLKTFVYSLEPTSPFLDYFAPWHVPKTVRGKLRFCVSSKDAAGNESNRSCAALTVR